MAELYIKNSKYRKVILLTIDTYS